MKQKEEKNLLDSEIKEICESVKMVDAGLRLREKINRINSAIQSLESKKVSIEAEIRIQKSTLAKKRSELKKQQKTISTKVKARLESTDQEEQDKQAAEELKKLDQLLLRESARILNF